MSTIERIFALVGLTVVGFAVAGALGIGHFRLYYGPENVKCALQESRDV